MNQAEFHIRPISPILQQQKENEITAQYWGKSNIPNPKTKNQKNQTTNQPKNNFLWHILTRNTLMFLIFLSKPSVKEYKNDNQKKIATCQLKRHATNACLSLPVFWPLPKIKYIYALIAKIPILVVSCNNNSDNN